jgi:hypothetical protein
MMDPVAMMALAVPLAPFLLGGLWLWTRHREKEMTLQARITAEKAAQYAQHTHALEERVRVLERIVTDRGYSLSQEIDALRVEDSDRRLEMPAQERA